MHSYQAYIIKELFTIFISFYVFSVVAVVNIQSLILKKHEEFLPFKLFIMEKIEFIYFFLLCTSQSHTTWKNFFFLQYFFLWISFATLKYQTIILKLGKHYLVCMEMPWMNISRQWNSDHKIFVTDCCLENNTFNIIYGLFMLPNIQIQIILKYVFKNVYWSLNFIVYQYYLSEITSCKFI